MNFYEKLEFNKLIKELDYIDSDLTYKTSLLKNADEDFIKSVNSVLEKFPQLKTIVDEKNARRFQNLVDINLPKINDDDDEIVENIVTESKPDKLKSLYRQIAKTTHPDKANQDSLKELYLDAQKAYDSNDILQMMSICERLKIDYEISPIEVNLVREEIKLKKERINFLESTYTWKWFIEESKDLKNQIVLNYLESQIIR
jgi:hypothetical protein